MAAPAPYDHYRSPGGDAAPPGVYRVVGVPGDETLLRLSDGDGNRVHDGRLVSVPPETLATAFEPVAASAVPSRDAGQRFAGLVRTGYYEARVLGGAARDRPLVSAVGVAALLVDVADGLLFPGGPPPFTDWLGFVALAALFVLVSDVRWSRD